MLSFLESPLKRRMLFTILGLILWCIIAIPTTLHFTDFGKTDKLKSSNEILSKSDSPNNIDLDFRVLSTNLEKRTMRVYIGVYPNGINHSVEDRTWNRTIELQFLHKNFLMKKGSTPEPVTFEIPLQTGNLKDYPFDKYTTDIVFLAVDISTKEYIPVTIYESIYNQNTKITLKRDQELGDLKLEAYIINIKRTPLVFAFCFFISVVTWGLTVVAFNIGIDSMVFHRELPPPLLAIGITMLFALPTLRKAQPEIPEIGCAIDFLCFIWCEILIGIASCMILYSWLLRYKLPFKELLAA